MQASTVTGYITSVEQQNTRADCHGNGDKDPEKLKQSTTATTCRIKISKNCPDLVYGGNPSKLVAIIECLLKLFRLFLRTNQKWLPSRFKNSAPINAIDPKSADLLVIGVGQMRTGTSSLKCALEILYNSPCYHMYDVAFVHKQNHIRKWLYALQLFQASTKEENGNIVGLNKKFWQDIFQDYAATVDYPSCVFYKHLLTIYPEAKFILTLRNPDDWVKSCRATTMCDNMLRQPTIGDKVYAHIRGSPGLSSLHHRMFELALGPNYSTMSDDQLKNAFIKWNQQVISTIPPERLLLFDPKQGWEPLCRFLGVSQPPSNVPFPHLNTREDMKLRLKEFYRKGRVINYLLFAVLALVIFAVLSYLFMIQCGQAII